MLMKLLTQLFAKKPEWEYGTCNQRRARRHIKNGNVQFVMWKAGEQGHTEDYWVDFDSWWWPQFIFLPDNVWGFSHEVN